MPADISEAQTTAAQQLAKDLYILWQKEADFDVRFFGAAFFMTHVLATQATNMDEVKNLLEAMAFNAVGAIDQIPGWPESYHGKED